MTTKKPGRGRKGKAEAAAEGERKAAKLGRAFSREFWGAVVQDDDGTRERWERVATYAIRHLRSKP